jgi:hypothetical protein
MDKLKEMELEERKLLESVTAASNRLLSLQRQKSLLRSYGDGLFRRGILEADADLASSSTPAPGSPGAPHAALPSGGVSDASCFPPLSDADWAVMGFDPALLADPGSAGGTVPSGRDSPGSRDVPTS